VRLASGQRLFRLTTLIAIAGSSFALERAEAQEVTHLESSHPSIWQASIGVAATNWFTWGYNWYIQRWPWSNVSLRTWGKNFREGFAWDDDCFLDNQLAHPYHGSLYLNSARASGYGFWKSVPFVAGGSASWEFLGENIRPSLNDFINTTLGGMAIGEVTFRLGSLLRARPDGVAAGLDRQLASLVVSPLARAQSLVHGASEDPELLTTAQPTPLRLAVGRHQERTFLQLDVRYGDPFSAEFRRPYDAFDFTLDLGAEAGARVSQIAISGVLARRILHHSERSDLGLGLVQHYDYRQSPVLELGGQSLSAALLYRRRLGSGYHVDMGINAEGLVLGAISSDYGQYWRRDYDIGPGAGGRFSTSLQRNGQILLRLDGRLSWIHSLHGSDGEHVATLLRLSGGLPLRGSFALGGDLESSRRHSMYPDAASVNRKESRVRAYLIWQPS
jgi:Domain of unknown function (DUF3943)